jgi:hypothetical protein
MLMLKAWKKQGVLTVSTFEQLYGFLSGLQPWQATTKQTQHGVYHGFLPASLHH